MKKILIIITLMFSSILYANPAPFGLEIHKTTLKEAQEKYTLVKKGISYYSGGPMYLIEKDELKIDGLNKVTLIFSKDTKVLLYVCAEFGNYKFNSLYKNLSKKYKLLDEEIPRLGNKFAKFENDQTFIKLDAPHMSFELEVTYIYKEFDKYITERDKKDKAEKNEKELESL